MILCLSWTFCFAVFSKPAASKESKPWERALVTALPPPSPSCLPRSLPPRGVHGLKGHSLCLTALVWKPGSDCCLCLGLCKARALSFSLCCCSRRCYCIGLALAQGHALNITSLQIYLLCEQNPIQITPHTALHSRKPSLKWQPADSTLCLSDKDRKIDFVRL